METRLGTSRRVTKLRREVFNALEEEEQTLIPTLSRALGVSDVYHWHGLVGETVTMLDQPGMAELSTLLQELLTREIYKAECPLTLGKQGVFVKKKERCSFRMCIDSRETEMLTGRGERLPTSEIDDLFGAHCKGQESTLEMTWIWISQLQKSGKGRHFKDSILGPLYGHYEF
ncbi:hypothetical protein Tco_1335127 [Tanacetum coccineum]